jgi:hypothetical protein
MPTNAAKIFIDGANVELLAASATGFPTAGKAFVAADAADIADGPIGSEAAFGV